MITIISSLVVLLILFPSMKTKTVESYPETHPESTFEIGKPYPIAMAMEALSPLKRKDKSGSTNAYLNWQKYTIRSGDSLAILFQRVGIAAATLHHLINTDEHTKTLASLNVKDEIQLGFDENGQFKQLRHPRNINSTLVVTRDGDNFSSKIELKKIETQVNFASAVIESSFWNAAIKAGLTGNQIMDLAGIFGWDIDFALDLRQGDSFSILYEELFIDGELINQGNILAATFTNQGDTYTAVRFDSNKYYDENGRAMRKTFLRSPVNFRYVSSNFNPTRLHPVTGRVKAHNGTDYVAPVGTPIWAAGNGTVIESAYNKFNGNYVFIRHNSTYVTKYLHLTKRLVKTGERVKQGDKIGTLGGTGRVTGPHLHYEFLVNGVHKNPRTVKLPQAQSLSGTKKKIFSKLAKERLDKLNKLNNLLSSIGSLDKNQP